MRQRSLFASRNTRSSWRASPPPSLGGIKDILFDFETSGLKHWDGDYPTGLAIGRCSPILDKPALDYLPFRHAGGNLDEGKVKEWARRELRDKDIYGFNIKFDNHVAHAWGVDLEAQGCRLHDVSLSAALLNDHLTKFKLDDIAQDELGVGKIDDIDVTAMVDLHASEVAPYAMRDIELVGGLKDVYAPRLKAEGLDEVQALEDATIFPVCEMERNAAPLNIDLLNRWVRQSEQELLRLVLEIQHETGIRIEPSKPASFAKVFYALDLPILHYTPTGQPSFTDEILSNYDHPIVKKAQRARRLSSLRSKYLISYSKVVSSGKLRYNLHQLRGDWDEGGAKGTISGRFSSSNKNIQQVMSVENWLKKFGDEYIIRELFQPEEGLFLASDAAQIEFRIFVALSRSRRLIEEYKKNPRMSFHEVVWEWVKRFNEEIAYKPLKNLNFAKLYGAGVWKIAQMINLPEDEARTFIEVYDRALPEVKALSKDASRTAERRGYVKTILGRRTRFIEHCKCPACAHHGLRSHKALNGVIQGSAADIMKKKIVELHKERKYTGFKMRFTVHDEVCGDVPDVESARRVDEVLNRQSFKLSVPILWETKVGPDWAHLKELAS